MKVNKIKLEPLEYRVVVLPDPIDETLGSGVLVKAESTKETDKRAQTKGRVIALSQVAFEHDWYGRIPKVGERVEYQIYAGQKYIEDKVEYTIMNDTDIIGILEG